MKKNYIYNKIIGRLRRIGIGYKTINSSAILFIDLYMLVTDCGYVTVSKRGTSFTASIFEPIQINNIWRKLLKLQFISYADFTRLITYQTIIIDDGQNFIAGKCPKENSRNAGPMSGTETARKPITRVAARYAPRTPELEYYAEQIN